MRLVGTRRTWKGTRLKNLGPLAAVPVVLSALVIAGQDARATDPKVIVVPRPVPEMAPLYHWYSESRGDNFLTTDPRWEGSSSAVRPPDYRYVGIDALVFSADQPQPAGTVPLTSWWNSRSEDNALRSLRKPVVGLYPTGGKQWPNAGYKEFRLEGYVYEVEPTEHKDEGLTPLYTWFSPERGDYFTTAQESWAGRSGDVRHGDYQFVRLEGFAKAMVQARSAADPPDYVPERSCDNLLRCEDGLWATGTPPNCTCRPIVKRRPDGATPVFSSQPDL